MNLAKLEENITPLSLYALVAGAHTTVFLAMASRVEIHGFVSRWEQVSLNIVVEYVCGSK